MVGGKRIFYTPEFEEFWHAYPVPDFSSKKKAYESYIKADLPSHPLLLKCVEAYKNFIRDNSRPNNPYKVCHATTWLNQARWESFLDRAERLLAEEKKLTAHKEASISASSSTWPEEVLAKLGMTEAVLKTWILPCVLKSGSPAEVVAPTKFHAQWLASQFPHKLERALGSGVVVSHA